MRMKFSVHTGSFTISASYRAWCGPWRSASPPTRSLASSPTTRSPRAHLVRCLQLVVGQAATVLQSVLTCFASELLVGSLARLRDGVGGQSAVTRRAVMNAIAAQ